MGTNGFDVHFRTINNSLFFLVKAPERKRGFICSSRAWP